MGQDGRSKQRKPDATGSELLAAWVEAGTPKYRDLATLLVQQGRYKSVTGAFSSIGYFASRDNWQDRKAQALEEAAMASLQEAARIDATSFLKTSKEIATRLKYTTSEYLDPLLKMRESVRRPAPKTPADLKITHTGTVTHNHRDLSMFTDDEIISLAAVAERSKAERV